MATTFQHFSKNGEILSIEQATVSLSNIAYTYGFGVYESLKVRNATVYFMNQHVDRLFQSAETIGLTHPFTKEAVKKYLSELQEKIQNTTNENTSYNLKILLIGGVEPLFFILPLAPHFPDRKLYSEGATTLTVHYERIFPHAKTLNMLQSYMSYTKAKKSGCYDALLISKEGNIIEGTRTNFFAIKGTTLFSPPKEQILEGVTRMTMVAMAQKNGFTLNETDIPLAKIAEYDGAFLTSTSSKIVPVKKIDDVIFGEIPEKVKELIKLYDSFLDESKGIF